MNASIEKLILSDIKIVHVILNYNVAAEPPTEMVGSLGIFNRMTCYD